MKNNIEKFLPIGSVVTLKKMEKEVMIIGYLVSTPVKGEKVFDYMACLYPEGVISMNKNVLFNHSDIKRVHAIGYSDDNQKVFTEKLKVIDKTIYRSELDELSNIIARYSLGNITPNRTTDNAADK